MNRRPLTLKETEALRHIRNRIVHVGEPPSVRELRDALGYSSPNAAAYILERLIEAGYLRRRKDGKLQLLRDAAEDPSHARTIAIPLVGSVPCGVPLLAEQNVEAMIPVSTRLARPPHCYFLLRAKVLAAAAITQAGKADPGPLDSISVAAYVRWWTARGARLGRMDSAGLTIVWQGAGKEGA